MAFNDIAFAFDRQADTVNSQKLSPHSRFIYGEKFTMEGEREGGSSSLSFGLKEDAALVYASLLIGRALETAGSADNISEKALRALLKKHMAHTGVDWSALTKEGKTFCLPVNGQTESDALLLRYYLPADDPAHVDGRSSKPVGTGTARVISEKVYPGFRPAHEIKLLLPAAGTTRDEQQYGEEFRKYMALDNPEESSYMMQGTFERAMEYEPGKIFSSNPWQFMLYAIETYTSDTPKNDLSLVPIWLGSYEKKLTSSGYQAIKKSLDDVLAQLDFAEKRFPSSLKGVDNIYIGDVGDEEAKETVSALLKLRDKHIGSIDKLIETVKREAPDFEFLRDISAYYRTRVVDFFDELEKRSSAMDAKEKRLIGLLSHEEEHQDTAIKDEEAFALLEDFIEAIAKGKYQKDRKVDLRDIPGDTEIIIVGDLHERLDNLEAILGHRRARTIDGRKVLEGTVLDKIKSGKAVLVILGDAVHSDADINSPEALSMERSFRIMDMIMSLKVHNPDHVYYVLGNHDDPDIECAKMAKDPETGEIEIIRQSMLYRNRMREMYGEDYLELYREFVNTSPLRVLADGLAAMHAGPPKGLTLEEIKAVEYKDIAKEIGKGKAAAATMLWGRYDADVNIKHQNHENYGFLDVSLFSSRDINRYLKAVRQPEAFFVIAHSPGMIPKGKFYKEFERNRFVIYSANDTTGYLSYREGTLEVLDVSVEMPVASHYNPAPGRWRSRLKRILYYSGIFILAGSLSLLVTHLSGGIDRLFWEASGNVGLLSAAAGVMMGAAMVNERRGKKFRYEEFIEAASKMKSDDEYVRMAGARDLLSMDVPAGLEPGDQLVAGIEEFMLSLLLLDRSDYVKTAAVKYLAKLGARYPAGERTWKGLFNKMIDKSTSMSLRGEILRFFAGTISVYPDDLSSLHRAAFVMLIAPIATGLHVMTVRMMGNLIRQPFTTDHPEMAQAFTALAEIAATGSITVPVKTWAGIHAHKQVFDSPRVQNEAIDQLYKIFEMELNFVDLVLALKRYMPQDFIKDVDVARGGTVTVREVDAAANFPAGLVWSRARQTFEAMCHLLLEIIKNSGSQEKAARTHAAFSLRRVSRRWATFLEKRAGLPLVKDLAVDTRKKLGSYIGGRMYTSAYGGAPLMKEENVEVALSMAENFIEFSAIEHINDARRVLESITPLLFDPDQSVASRAQKIAVSLCERFPDIKRDRSFARLENYLYGKKDKGPANRILSILPWAVLAGTAALELALGGEPALASALTGMMALGVTLLPEDSGEEDLIAKSLDHMLTSASRSVHKSRNNEDITTREESRLQMCSVDILTDPDRVDLVASGEDMAHVYLLMERIKKGKMAGADTKPVKIYIDEKDGKIRIWEGKHRLTALKRLGVMSVPVHVVYRDRSFMGQYPFEDITGTHPVTDKDAPRFTAPAGQNLIPDPLAEAEDISRTVEAYRIDDVVGFQMYYSEGVENWGVYAPTPITIALNVLLYMRSVKPDASICDLGSGAGRFCFLAAMAPGFDFSRATGIEGRELLYHEALRNKQDLEDLAGGEKLDLINGDFLEEDLSGHDFLYFFFTSPSSVSHEEFNRALFEKLTSPTGLKPGAQFVMWGNFDDISDGRKLLRHKIKLGLHEFDVYTRTEEKKTPEAIATSKPWYLKASLMPLFIAGALAGAAVLGGYLTAYGAGITPGILAFAALGSVLPVFPEGRSDQATLPAILEQLAHEDELIRMAASRRLADMEIENGIDLNGALVSSAQSLAQDILLSDETGTVKMDLLSFARNFREKYPRHPFLEETLTRIIASEENEEALRREAVKVLLVWERPGWDAAAEAYWAIMELILYSREEQTKILCLEALERLFNYEDTRDNVINKRIFSVLEEIAEFGRLSFSLDLDSEYPDGYMLFSEQARVQALNSIKNVHVGEIRTIGRAFARDESVSPGDLAKVLSENFRNRYGLFAYLVTGQDEFFHPLPVRIAAAEGLRNISGEWNSLFAKYSLSFANDSIAARYVKDMRNFIVAGIYQVVYGNNARKIDRDMRVRLMISDLLAEYGIPESVSARAVLGALEPMVFEADETISAQAEKLILDIGDKDSSLKRDPVAGGLLRLCAQSVRKRQARGGLGLMSVFLAVTAGAAILHYFAHNTIDLNLAGWLLSAAVLGAVVPSGRDESREASGTLPAPVRVTESPYGLEKNISRRFLDLDHLYMRDISQELLKRTALYQGSGQQELPVKILIIGVGRGLEAFDLMNEYGDSLDITITAKEDLLYTAEELIEHGGYMIDEEEAQKYVERAREGYIMCDLDKGIDLEDNSFDIVITGSGTASYVKDKWEAVKEMIRVCKEDGVVYFSPHLGRIKLEGEDLTFGEYFASIEHPLIDSLVMTDMGPVERRKRTSDWLKITKTQDMELPSLELVAASPIPASKEGKEIKLPLWDSVYAPAKETDKMSSPPAADGMVDIRAALTDAARPYMEDTRFSIKIEIEKDLPPVHGDHVEFYNVCSDLIKNAAEMAVAEGLSGDSAKIVISAAAVVKDGRRLVEITFADNGQSTRTYDPARAVEKMGGSIETRILNKKTTPKAEKKDSPGIAEEIARDFIDTMMIRRVETQGSLENTILVLSTSWIKNYAREDLAYRDINRLVIAVRAFARSRGITCVVTDDSKVISDIRKETAKKDNAGARVIVLAGKEKVTSADFRDMVSKTDNVFAAGVSGQTERILELLVLTMKLAFGQDTEALDWGGDISWEFDPVDPDILIFSLPDALPLDWAEPVKIYQKQRDVLIKA